MSDQPSERVRELEERISQWERVQKHGIQQERDDQLKLRQTLALSMRVAMFASIPSAIWLLCWTIVQTAGDSIIDHILFAFGVFVLFAAVTAGMARFCGLAAHWWFRRSDIQESLAVTMMSLAGSALLFWWMTFLMRF